MKYGRYVGWILGLTFVVCFLNAALVFWIDPRCRLGRNPQGSYDWAKRDYVTSRLPVVDPEAVFFSNSKLFMVDPDALEGFDWFNAAFGSASIEEMVGLIEALVQHVQVCLIAIDFWQFHADWPPVGDPLHPPGRGEWLVDYLLSHQMARRSLVTAMRHHKGDRPLMMPEGFIHPESYQERLAELRRKPQWMEAVQAGDQAFAQMFILADSRIELLRQTVRRLEERGILPIVMLHPQHPGLLARLESPELREHYEAFRQAMRAAFPDMIDLTYHYPEVEAYLEGDPMHYRPEIAEELINEIVVPAARERLHRRRPILERKRPSKLVRRPLAGT